MASNTQNQCPHPVPTNHTGCFQSPTSARSHFLEPEWASVLFCSETESHYVSLADLELSMYIYCSGFELIIYTKLVSHSQGLIAISLLRTEITNASHHT